MVELVDMHMHAGFVANAARFASALADSRLATFSNTVTPAEYLETAAEFGACPRVRVGLGLHPWWLDGIDSEQAASMLEEFLALLPRTRYVGEIGLDFSARHETSRDLQLLCFERIVAACAAAPGTLLSIHSVKAEEAVLDVIERNRACESASIVMHSYGGSSKGLDRALELGCYLSIGSRMLSTKRGREYARIVPKDRLLIESDLPAHADDELDVEQLESNLRETLEMLATLRETERRALLESTTRLGLMLLGYQG